MDRDLNRSSSCGGSLGFGTEASCGPQLASEKGWSLVGSIGNLTNDSINVLRRLEKDIPKFLVPLR